MSDAHIKRQALRLLSKPKLLEGVPFHQEEVGRIFVLNPNQTAGGLMWPGEFLALDVDTIGGWYEIKQTDVTRH